MAFALITGASGGIGLSMARELASRKYDLLLVARSESKLNEIKAELEATYKVIVHVLSCDLSQPGAAADILQWASPYGIHVLINNAGYGIWGNVEVNHSSELQNMIQLNQVALVELSKAFIPVLKKQQGKTYIMNVGSTAAYQAVPALAVYAASKAFVVSFTRALRWELKDSNISVSCFSPGATSTGFMDRAKMNDSLKEKAEKFTMTAEEVARIGIKGMLAGKSEIIPGFVNWISAKMVCVVPKSFTESIAYKLYKTK